jgi:Ca2+-binding EF-hand superfamily protein
MALSVAHSQGIVHGRLSPKSLVLALEDDEEDGEDVELQLKVCGMGQGWLLRPGLNDGAATEQSFQLETYALSPELASGDLPGSSNTALPRNAEKCDIWAVGIIFYTMLSGTLPFKAANRGELTSMIDTTEVRFLESMWSRLSPAAKDAVQAILKVTPQIRLSAAQLLRHPWIKIAKTSFPRKRMVAVLNNIRVNISEPEFKRFVLRLVAEQLPRDGPLVGTVEQAFRVLDRNGDGILTVDEITRGLRKHLDLGKHDAELEKLVAGIDRDASGSVNMEEFIYVALDQRRSCTLPVLWDAFNAFDRDRGGTVTFDEIDTVVRDLEGVRLGQATAASLATEIRRELEEVGTNGCIDFDQFVYMLGDKPNASDGVKKDIYRVLWGCGVDCHNIRHTEPESTWDLRKAGANCSTKSVYRKKGNVNCLDAPAVGG